MTDQNEVIDVAWWEKTGDDAARMCHDVLCRIRNRQEYRRQQFLVFASMYGGIPMSNFGVPSVAQQTQWLGTQLSINVARSVVDSVLSSVASKSRPKAAFLTTNDWQLRRRAMKQEQLVDGAMSHGKYFRKLPLQFRDAMVLGTGSQKIYATKQGRVAFDLEQSWYTTVDDTEAERGEPMVRWQTKAYDKAKLAKLFPKKAEEIKLASRGDLEPFAPGIDPTANQIFVHEAWRLPSEPEGDDGKHVIFIAEHLLLEEPYDWDIFPFADCKWNPPQSGWYGDGLISEIAGIQLEINDILDELVEAAHGIKGFWAVEMNSEVNLDHINDELVKILKYAGRAPEYYQPQAIPADLYDHLWRLVAQAYEISGKSQLSATSKKPAGLSSGEALRAYADAETTRFLHKYQMLEDTVVDAADLTLRTLRKIAKDDKKTVALYVRSGDYLRPIDLNKVHIDREKYWIEIQPASQLPNTLAGRIETAQEMAKTGAFSPNELMDVMVSPDTKDLVHRRNATKRFVEAAFDAICEGEEFMPPEPEMDLQIALQIALNLYVEERELGAPPEIVDTMLRWISICKLLVEQGQAPAGGAAPPAPPAPPGEVPNLAPGAPMAPPPGQLAPSPIPAPPKAA